jgi:hypothetical protein
MAASAADRQHYALQTIFSFFLGLMVLALIGVGIITFYPNPQDAIQKSVQPLYNQMNLIQGKGGTQTATETAAVAALQKQIDELNANSQKASEDWAQATSVIMVLFATLVMGISLIRSDQLRVLSNGLLLGGLFTMIYGAGMTVFSGTSYLRFFVVLFALVVAIALGYAKFVWLRQGAGTDTAAGTEVAPADASADVAGLEARVAALEARTNAAAAALGTHEQD